MSGRLRNCWFGFFRRRETGESLALFRIACGVTTLTWILSAVFHDVATDVWLPVEYGGYRSFASVPWLFGLLGGLNPTTLWIVIGAYILSACAVTIGWGGRWSAFVLLQAFLAISDINSDVSGGDCRLAGNCLWLLVIAGGTATMSLDCRLREERWTSDRMVAAWPRYLVFYQLVVVYGATGLQKLSIDWTPAGGYSALYYILQEPTWQRWDMSWLAWVYPLTQVATAVTWIWEASAPLLILAAWYRATRDRPGLLRRLFNRIGFRRVYVTIGVMMHLGIFIFIDLSLFTWISLSMYPCLFTAAEWRGAWFAIRKRFVRGCETKKLSENLPKRGGQAHFAPKTPQNEPVPGGFPIGSKAQPPGRPIESSGALAATSPWRHRLVYAFVTFHLVAITLAALPAPPQSLKREDLATGEEAANVAAWSDRLNRLGWAVSPSELEEALWKAAENFSRIRKRILAPFQPYYKFCGTGQGWKMFVGPHHNPSRLHVEIRENGHWRPVYIEGSREHNWLRSRLNHEHWRTVLITAVYFEKEQTLQQFVRWAAKHAAQDFPDADKLRLRVYTFRTPSPEEVKNSDHPQGQFDRTIRTSIESERK